MRIFNISNCDNYVYNNGNYKKSYKEHNKKVIAQNINNGSKSYVYNLSFMGITSPGIVKQRGLMFHITNLPAERSFCGQFLDKQTTQFIEWLEKAKQTHWIMNPLNALDINLSPYSSLGRFSRNKFIINLNKLAEDEYGNILKKSELPDDISSPTFTLEMLEKQKNPRFKIAYKRFKNLEASHPLKQEYNKFLESNDSLWLDDYANYDMLSRMYGDNWTKWNKELQTAPEDARKDGISLNEKIISILKNKNNVNMEELFDSVGLYKFEQFLFDKQFTKQTEELKKHNINLILDLPIGVSPTGVDTWGKKNIFLLDKDFYPTKVTGVPGDKTQLWNQALYNYDSPEFWDYQEKSLKQLLKNADLRLDHFVAYINRAAIPTSYKKADGTILKHREIFYPIEKGGMGEGFFLPEWIENVYEKRNSKGENMFELFMRVAKDMGKKPEDTYILEGLGVLARTDAYKAWEAKYGQNFISQRIPIKKNMRILTNKEGMHSFPYDIRENNLALLSGNHDLPSLMECIDELVDFNKKDLTKSEMTSRKLFKRFCEKELKLTPEEMKNKDIIFENTMKWFYTKNVKQVQTTLTDALGIYFRPNIPGYWNGMPDKYLMKPTKEALLPYWSRVFPKDFLIREDKEGYNPGYKSLADRFVKVMNDLYSSK